MEEDIIKMLHDHEKRLKALEGRGKNEEPSASKHTEKSINEFLLETKPDGYTEKTVAFGHYLEENRNMDCFTRADIEAIFREARETVSKNTSKDIVRGIKKGWIMTHNQKKEGKEAYRITSKGIDAIKNKFAGIEDEK